MVSSSGQDGGTGPGGAPAADATWLAARARELAERGAPRDALVALDMALELVRGAPPDALQADLLREKGAVLADLGDQPGAEAHLHRSLEMSRNVRHGSGIAAAERLLDALHERRRRCS